MTAEETERLLSRLAFRAAMQKAFNWQLPLPDKALRALLNSGEFDDIFMQNRPDLADTLKAHEYDARHFEAIANDARVQLCVNEYLANEKERNYFRPIVAFIWKELQEGFRNWIRRLLNPRDGGSIAEHRPPDRIRYPVLKTAGAALATFVAVWVYQHPPVMQLNMLAPREFPSLHIDSGPVKFDTARVHFDDVKFEKPPALEVAKVQFGPVPELRIGKVQFDTPPRLNFGNPPDLQLKAGKLTLDAQGSITLSPGSNFKFDPLQLKDNTSIPLTFDAKMFSNPPKFQLDVNHHFNDLLDPTHQLQVVDKRQGLFWPKHTYTVQLSTGVAKTQASPEKESAKVQFLHEENTVNSASANHQ